MACLVPPSPIQAAHITGLEKEIPYPLSQVAADIEAALRRRSFRDRIVEKLATDPDRA